MSTQGGGAPAEKASRLSDPFFPGQYVTKHVKLEKKKKPADKAEVPNEHNRV